MPAPMSQGGPQSRDGLQESIIIAIGFCAALAFLWWSAHEQISGFIMKLRLLEAHLVPWKPQVQHAIRHWVNSTAPKDVTIDQLVQSGEILGQTLGWGSIAILVVICGVLVFRSPEWPGRFTQSYTMASLARQEASLWPAIRPVLDENLLGVSLDDPIQGMRQTPRAYGRRLKFVVPTSSLRELPLDGEPVNPRETLLVARARKVFALQLGRRWQGIDRLQPHERALFAAFAAQANYDNDSAQKLIDDLPVRFLSAVKAKDAKRITSALADPLIKQYADSDVVKRALSRHTYVRTVLMAMLVAARKNGVLPPSWFRWLKTVDRITWYSLNDLGTENASAEAAGVRCHWNAERLTRAPLDEPEVEAAIDGLRDYLQEILDEDPEND